MQNIDWDKFIADEDRIIENSDRKHRNHFVSLDLMSEELVYQMKVSDSESDGQTGFVKEIENPNLKKDGQADSKTVKGIKTLLLAGIQSN